MPDALNPLASATAAQGQMCAWQGEALLVVDDSGECGAGKLLTGLFYREARFLSELGFTVNGRRPWLCERARVSATTLRYTYVHPEIESPDGGGSGQADDGESLDADGLPFRSLDLLLTHEVKVASLLTTLTIGNHADEPVRLRLAWILQADFADLQETTTGERQQQAEVERIPTANGLQLAYAHEALPYRTVIHAGGAEWGVTPDGLGATLVLPSQDEAALTLSVQPLDCREVLAVAEVARRERCLDEWRDRFTIISIPGNPAAERVVRRNVAVFGAMPLLRGQEDEWLTAQAGLPLYPGLFGRDALTAGWQAAFIDQGALLDASLTRLGRLQGTEVNDWRDEQPGRLPAQARDGPLARLGLNPFALYYADYASPLMFVISLAHLYAWRGERDVIARHWDAARRVLDWARTDGDLDGDGYLEYLTRSPQGVKNQGWKDSGRAILDEAGAPVPAPIATAEVQGYWYAAQQLMAILAEVMGEHADATAFRESARDLKHRFNRDWWIEEQQSVGLAMGPDKRVIHVPASNAGHCLATGIISDEHLPAQVGRLFAPDLFSGWGIRTLSTTHPAYSPLSYHLGSIWPVENATIAFGLRRFGFDARAVELATAMFELAALYPDSIIPECVGGYARGERLLPGAYPRANPWQLWNATAMVLLMHTLLGLQPVAPLHLLVVDPVLPAWLPEVKLRGLRLGGATASIRFWRDQQGRSHAEVEHVQGTMHLLRQPPLESLHAGVKDRLGALMESVVH
ncbi:MAG TPA: glycogen debranching N-terminal domain-containing protein [Gemmatimonadales bacterium]|nr:glycogen debranching N-terminal domain-containing protein [Gemmatimonadales bacterium]